MKIRVLLVLLTVMAFTIAACDESTDEPVEGDTIEETNLDESRSLDEEMNDTPVEGTVPEIQENIPALFDDMTMRIDNIEQGAEEWVATVTFQYTGDEEDIDPFAEGVQEITLLDADGNEYPPLRSDEETGEVWFNAPDGPGPYAMQLADYAPVELNIE